MVSVLTVGKQYLMYLLLMIRVTKIGGVLLVEEGTLTMKCLRQHLLKVRY